VVVKGNPKARAHLPTSAFSIIICYCFGAARGSFQEIHEGLWKN